MTSTKPQGLDDAGMAELRVVQSGVVSARQLRELGARPHDVKRLLRRRDLTVIHPGVYLDHTGGPTWEQRAWAAVLAHWPAALTRESAMPDPPEAAPIQVAIDVRRTVRDLPGVLVWRMPELAERVRWNRSPPRVRLEQAVLEVLGDLADDPTQAFRVLADVCQARHTSPAAMRAALTSRRRVAGRTMLVDLLDDLEAGACSVLEREWLRVERAHGLPGPQRQASADLAGRRVYRDAEHEELGVVVELDGRAFHDTAAARERDAQRDLEAACLADRVTVRLTYGQVFRSGCATAHHVGRVLRARGWSGDLVRCPACPGSWSRSTPWAWTTS